MNETKRCPYCGEEILAIAKKCKHCGEWLTDNTPENDSGFINLNSKNSTFEKSNTPSKREKDTDIIKVGNKRIWFILLSGLFLLVIIIAVVLGRTSSNKETIISEEPIEEVEVIDNSNIQSPSDEIDFSDSWEVKYFKDSFGEDDKSDPYIQKEFTTESEPINILFSKNGFAIFGEYFPSLVEELTIKDENGNLTIVPCLENAPDKTLMASDANGYKTLVDLLDNGKDFTLRLKVWDFGNEHHYKAYKVSGWSGQGVKNAIQKHIID